MSNTTRLTTAQAIVKFLDNQYVSMDGVETKFVEGFFTIFGHGIAVGLGEALDTNPGGLKVMQGRNEQGMCHTAIAFAKQNCRKQIIACASSVGPGAANMVTACATATVNNIPLLVFPADTFASRQPDPVLQQLEQSSSLAVSTNDAFKPVCKYWDRITRPEQVMTALISAMRVLTDPAETGACCIALPQDVEGESYDFPTYFFEKRVHRITRPVAVEEELEDIAQIISKAKKPLVIVGGGVRYSDAGEAVEQFCEEFRIPFGESQAGKSACKSSHPYCLGGIGVTGTYASNHIAKDADVVIAIGSRMSDFTTSSKRLYQHEGVKFVTINNCRFHAYKMDAVKAVGDAKVTVQALAEKLRAKGWKSAYTNEILDAKAVWAKEMERLGYSEIVIEVNSDNEITKISGKRNGVTYTMKQLGAIEVVDPAVALAGDKAAVEAITNSIFGSADGVEPEWTVAQIKSKTEAAVNDALSAGVTAAFTWDDTAGTGTKAAVNGSAAGDADKADGLAKASVVLSKGGKTETVEINLAVPSMAYANTAAGIKAAADAKIDTAKAAIDALVPATMLTGTYATVNDAKAAIVTAVSTAVNDADIQLAYAYSAETEPDAETEDTSTPGQGAGDGANGKVTVTVTINYSTGDQKTSTLTDVVIPYVPFT